MADRKPLPPEALIICLVADTVGGLDVDCEVLIRAFIPKAYLN